MAIDYDAIKRKAEKRFGETTAAGEKPPAAIGIEKTAGKISTETEGREKKKSGRIDYDAVWKRAEEKYGTVRRPPVPKTEATQSGGNRAKEKDYTPLPKRWVPSWRQEKDESWREDVDMPLALPEKVMDIIMPRSVMPELREQYDESLAERIREEERKAQERQAMREAGYREPTFRDTTWGSIKRGYLEAEKGKENFNVMLGGDDARKKELEEILAGEEYRFVPEGFLDKAVSGSMEMVGQQGSQLWDPLTIGAIGSFAGTAALAGQAGPQALVPEEVITVPAAAAMGWKAGSAMTNMKIEAGNAYEEMLERGVDRDTAKLIAAVVGGVNGALEGAQMSSLMKGLNVVEQAGSKSLRDLFVQELKRRGLDVADNVVQEVLQEGSTVAGTQLGSKLSTGQWAYTADEVRDRLGQTARDSALTFGMMNIPGAVRNIAWNAGNIGRSVADSKAKESWGDPVEPLDTQTGERYDGGKEIKQGGLNDGRGEEAGRFDAGVGESGGRYDRETLWYQAKEADTGGGSRSEGDSAFVARVSAEGKTIAGEGRRRYAYRLTAEEGYAPATREALETAKEWGLVPTVVDSFEKNNGKTTIFGADAVTGPQGQVFLVNGSGKEEIAHEGLHSGLRRDIPEAKRFLALTEQIDLSKEKISRVVGKIVKTYYDDLGIVFDPKKDMQNLNEEFAAFLSGMIETGRIEEFFGLTETTDPEIFTAWRDFKAAMGANPMPQADLQGDGPVSPSLDAFSGKKKPLVDDLMADELLRNRSTADFLTRKGGLELKPGMTQAEKRQAVQEAVERIARHGKSEIEGPFSALNPREKADPMKPQGEETTANNDLETGIVDLDVEGSEIGDTFRRTLKGFAEKGNVVSFEKLPQEFQSGFLAGLDTAAPEVKTLLSEAYGKADYVICQGKHSYYDRSRGKNIIMLGKSATPSTLAHELFHRMDKGHRISRGLSSALTQDFVALQVVSGGDIKGYLMRKYPEAFYTTKFGKTVMYKQYRGIADILNGLSEGKVSYGFRHPPKYWEAQGALEAEAWAQFGRIMYDNDPNVKKMFADIFSNLMRDAIIKTRGGN